MVILDSSVWIAFLNKNDSQHQKAVRVFNKLSPPVIMPEYIILEVASVLASRVKKELTDQFLELCFNSQEVEVLLSERGLFEQTVDFFKKAKKLSFVDAQLLVLSNFYPVITFDNNLSRAINALND
jgi:predicted nucleic acid-binding protein